MINRCMSYRSAMASQQYWFIWKAVWELPALEVVQVAAHSAPCGSSSSRKLASSVLFGWWLDNEGGDRKHVCPLRLMSRIIRTSLLQCSINGNKSEAGLRVKEQWKRLCLSLQSILRSRREWRCVFAVNVLHSGYHKLPEDLVTQKHKAGNGDCIALIQ